MDDLFRWAVVSSADVPDLMNEIYRLRAKWQILQAACLAGLGVAIEHDPRPVVPAAVVELANRLLRALPVEVPQTTSFRTDGRLTITESPDVVAAVRRALPHEGSIGVIAADHRIIDLTDAIQAAGIDTVRPGGDGRVTVVPASLAKGLEYDHVIAIEPTEIVEAEPRGLNRLYVILTRAVSRLEVLHTRELPKELS